MGAGGPRPPRRDGDGPFVPNRNRRPGAPSGPGGPRRDGQGPGPHGPNRRPGGPSAHAGPRKRLGPATNKGPAPRGEEGADRLQKVLAHAGIGSRRACEDYITQGRVTINGETVRELGTKVVHGRDKVAVDGQPIHDERPAYIAVNKPKGYVSTNADPSGRPRVVDLVPDIPQRVYTVGRLDEMSTGLMLLTNDGEMANRLAHPKFGVEKVYRAVIAGTPDPEVFTKLVEGVWLAEGKVRAKRVKPIAHKGDSTVVELVLAEGKNREVRRMFAKFGHKVMTLTRVAVGPITLKGLKPGGWRFLTAGEVDLLKRVAAGLPVPTGRYGHDRPAKRPTRGPNAAHRPMEPEGRGPRPRLGPAGGPPRHLLPPSQREDAPSRPRLARMDNDGPPRFARPGQGGGGDRRPMPPRPGGPPRPPHPQAGGPGRPRLGPPPRPQQGGGPRPQLGGPPRPAPRPFREDGPTRRIIGMEPMRDSGGPENRRPMPRRRPGPGPGGPIPGPGPRRTFGGPPRPMPQRRPRPQGDRTE